MTGGRLTRRAWSSRGGALAALLALGCAALAGGWMQSQQRSFRWDVHDMKRPQPPVVQTGAACTMTPPSDAIVLFGGGDTSKWVKAGSASPIEWKAEGGVLTIVPRSGDIATRDSFGDCQFHIEWMVPTSLKCDGQKGCNSGIFFLSRYELQILNSSGNVTYVDGMAGSMYGQHPPLVNACRPQGEWNVYDVVFRGPRFDAAAGIVRTASMTVLLNGVLVQENAEVLGETAHMRRASYTPHAESAPIKLQDHGDALQFRNIWVRPLGAPAVAE